MDNEVVIKVTADDDTRQGFDSVRQAGTKLGKDLETDTQRAGPLIGSGLGKGISTGLVSSSAGIAKSIGTGLVSSAGSVGSMVAGPLGTAIGAPAGAAVATVLMGTLSAALSGGVGAAGLGAGIALAVKNDPELLGLGKAVGKRLFDDLGDQANAALGGPIKDSINTLAGYGDIIVDQWGGAFRKLAPFLEPLADKIGRGVSILSESLANVAGESGPVLDALGDSFITLADAVGYSLERITDDAEGSGEALRVFSGFVAEETKSVADLFAGMAEDIKYELESIGVWDELVERYGGGTHQMRKWNRELAESSKEATDAANGQRTAFEALADELKAQADPVFGILKAQEALKEAQDATAKATREHGKNSAEAEEALRDQAMAALDLESNIGKLGGTFDGKMTPAMRSTLRAAGLTDSAIQGLERQFRAAKREGDQFSKTYTANARVTGVTQAKNSLYSVRDAANDIPRAVTIALRITGGNNVSAQAAAIRKNMFTGGIAGAQNGATSNGLTWVGEGGPELVDLPPGTRVHSNPDSQRLVQQSGGNVPPIHVTLMMPDGSVLLEQMVDPMRDMVRTQFGGSVQSAYGRN